MSKKQIEKNLIEVLDEVAPKTPTIKKNDNITIKFKLLSDEAELPKYAHDGDNGMDIKAVRVEYDIETDCYKYYTGIACESPEAIGCLVMPRSSNCNTDSYLTNSIGLVDSFTYRGDIGLRFKCRTSRSVRIMCCAMYKYHFEMNWFERLFTPFKDVYNEIEREFFADPIKFAPYAVGERLGQLVFVRFPKVKVKKVDKLSETKRGKGGHGSTGKK